ncbi:MYO6 [Bugula neritina]|uniref:MYO6 n=1 Tax=Bugula neritina TaxID=10212 RepID=A0A7J7JPJ3_BUGNE|nr:MYO6 [Bugula neritina]
MSKAMLQQGPLHDINRDDVKDFQRTWAAMDHMGITDNEKMAIFAIIAGVLHLGNIAFEDDVEDKKGGCDVTAASQRSLSDAATLFGLNKDDLKQALTSRVMQATRSGVKGTAIMVPLKTGEAASARDALAKSVYSHVFDHIVSRINQALPFSTSKNFIGILDIAGFEYFQHNSFEQFCINYCNEKLQQFFNQRILKEEQEMYEKEGLGVKRIEFTDNADCIELIERKGVGIFDILDEEHKLPRPTYDHFTTEVYNKNKNHRRIGLPRKSKLKAHREIRDDQGFLIRHFAGGVVYNTEQFLEKNNDALHHNLEFLVAESSNGLVKHMFSKGQSASAPSSAKSTGKLNFDSVGSKFRAQLTKLLEKLKSTGTSFIRCIKPNSKMADHMFEGSNVLSQLQCAGMHNVLDLMQQGFPSRTSFTELYNMYKRYLPPVLARLDPRLFCKALFKALGLNEHDFKFGMTKVFFRAGKFAEFDQMMKSDPENLAKLVEKVKVWLIRSRFKKAQYGAWSVIKLRKKIEWRREMLIKIQKTVKMYKGIQKVRTLHKELVQMDSIINKLKKNKDSAKAKCQQLTALINATIQKIKVQPMSREQIDSEYNALLAQVHSQIQAVSKMVEEQRMNEEKERLRKIQEEMERERLKKEAEEKARKEEELRRIQRMELEAQRKAEEEKRRIQEEEDRKAAEKLSSELAAEQEDTERRRQAIEQERRDRELALRLAQEDQDQVEDVSLPAQHQPMEL